MWKTLKAFYNSPEWLGFREIIILERGPICEECGKKITVSKDIILHHIEELTLDNVNDTFISLNPTKIKVVCFDCHNKIHNRFGYGYKPPKKKSHRAVYIVYGPPLSGKTSYVLENKEEGDLVVDIDRLYQAVTLNEPYDKPKNLFFNVISIHNHVIDNIKTRYGKFHNAWIIGGYADKHKREMLARELGAELIFINTSKEECMQRLKTCNDNRQKHASKWEKYIDKWFSIYRE